MPVLRSKRVIVVQTDYYTIYLEPYLDRLWVHVDVHKWTPAIRRDYQMRFDRVMDKVGLVYAINMDWGHKLRHKFMMQTGWTYYKKCSLPKSKGEYDVYRRYPKCQD